MICLECGCEDFEIKEMPFELTIAPDNQKLHVLSNAYACTSCEFTLMDTHQMDEFRQKIGKNTKILD